MDLFPTGLDNSLFPAIFLGVLVTFAAVETLGWTFTGLVVPGYLASVALVAPRAAGLMVVEALVTLAIVRLVADGAAAARVASRFFGREAGPLAVDGHAYLGPQCALRLRQQGHVLSRAAEDRAGQQMQDPNGSAVDASSFHSRRRTLNQREAGGPAPADAAAVRA